MWSLSPALALLLQFWALQGATSLWVQQRPEFLRVSQDSEVTLACQVSQLQAWERLRVEWTKDSNILCQLLVTNSSLSSRRCGAGGQLSWRVPGDLNLTLEHVSVGDSGNYTCRVTMEIPELEEAAGHGTQLLVHADGPQLDANLTPSFPGLLLALLVAGGAALAVAVAGVALAAGIWSCRRRGREDTGDRAGNPFYCNVLYRPRGTPKKSEDWPGEGKTLDTPREDQKGHRIYLTSLPQPAPRQLHPAPKPCPRPGHPISTVRVPPGPGPSG